MEVVLKKISLFAIFSVINAAYALDPVFLYGSNLEADGIYKQIAATGGQASYSATKAVRLRATALCKKFAGSEYRSSDATVTSYFSLYDGRLYDILTGTFARSSDLNSGTSYFLDVTCVEDEINVPRHYECTIKTLTMNGNSSVSGVFDLSELSQGMVQLRNRCLREFSTFPEYCDEIACKVLD